MMGGAEDPESGPVVAGTAFAAVGVYGVGSLSLFSLSLLLLALGGERWWWLGMCGGWRGVRVRMGF